LALEGSSKKGRIGIEKKKKLPGQLPNKGGGRKTVQSERGGPTRAGPQSEKKTMNVDNILKKRVPRSGVGVGVPHGMETRWEQKDMVHSFSVWVIGGSAKVMKVVAGSSFGGLRKVSPHSIVTWEGMAKRDLSSPTRGKEVPPLENPEVQQRGKKVEKGGWVSKEGVSQRHPLGEKKKVFFSKVRKKGGHNVEELDGLTAACAQMKKGKKASRNILRATERRWAPQVVNRQEGAKGSKIWWRRGGGANEEWPK